MVLQSAVVGFLIEVGRWAMTELNERWKLRRTQRESDLSNEEQLRKMLADLSNPNTKEFESVKELITMRRQLIVHHKIAMVAEAMDYEKSKLSAGELTLRRMDHERNIEDLTKQIARDLLGLLPGSTLEREKI